VVYTADQAWKHEANHLHIAEGTSFYELDTFGLRVLTGLHKNLRMSELASLPPFAQEELYKLYQIFEQAYQVPYDRVKAESERVMEGFDLNPI
jgi:hypothetical protein